MKINKWIYTATLGVLLASCQTVETPMFNDKDDTFIAFVETEVYAAEDGDVVKIPVQMVASKAYDATVNFSVNATAYEGKNPAEEGTHYRVKNETKSLTFVNDGDLIQYIELEMIDNSTQDGDLFFDITLHFDGATRCKCHANGIHISLGADYTAKVIVTDDEDPMNQAGILGKFTAEAVSLFDDSPLSWTCEIKKDYESGGLGVWVGPLFPDATYQAVYGTVSKDYTTITFDLAQSLNSDGSIVLDFLGASNVATCNNGTIQFVALGAMATGGGYYYAMAPVTLTKVDK